MDHPEEEQSFFCSKRWFPNFFWASFAILLFLVFSLLHPVLHLSHLVLFSILNPLPSQMSLLRETECSNRSSGQPEYCGPRGYNWSKVTRGTLAYGNQREREREKTASPHRESALGRRWSLVSVLLGHVFSGMTVGEGVQFLSVRIFAVPVLSRPQV